MSSERAVITRVRAIVDARDGYCRFACAAFNPALRALLGPCEGPSEWAHIEEYRRGKTVNQPPEMRHKTIGSVMMCRRHHQGGPASYDRHGFWLEPLTDRGADGPLRVMRRDGQFWDEPSEVS